MPPLKYPINEEGSDSGSRNQPQRRRRRSSASSAPSLRRSSRLKRRRVDYADSSDNMDLDGEEYGSRADHGGDNDYEIPCHSDHGTEEEEEDEEENGADDYEGSLGYHSHMEDDGFQRPMEKCCHIEEGDHDSGHHENQRDHGYNADDDNEDDKPSTTPHSEEQPEAEAFLLLEEDRELTLSILFAAIVPISELQLLVYYDKKKDKYFLHGDEVDWISVSTVAEGLAPNGFKGLYSPEACRDMFLSEKTNVFRQNAMLPKNWETFRTTMSFDDDHPEMVDHFARNVGDEGTCPECGIFTYRLKEHSDSCIGVCEACDFRDIACVRPRGQRKCLACLALNKKCTGARKQERSYPPKQQCHKCWDFTLGSGILSHITRCRGRCQACVADGVPCVKSLGSRRCKGCKEANKECINFTHQTDGFCEKCGRTVPDLKNHTRYCEGRCGGCRDPERIPCVPVPGTESCQECIRLGKGPCKDFSHPKKPKRAGTCLDCGCNFPDLDQHKLICRETCTECFEDKIPCVRNKGRKRCEYCISKGKKVCRTAVTAKSMVICDNCGREVPKYHLKSHVCTGKCINCEEAGADCIRPYGNSRRPCERCEEMGDQVDHECDGSWRHPKQKKENGDEE